jgi:hypothetical protein
VILCSASEKSMRHLLHNSRHCGECFPETEEFLSYRVLVALFQYDRIFGRDSQAFPVRAYMSVSEEETVPSDFFCQ